VIIGPAPAASGRRPLLPVPAQENPDRSACDCPRGDYSEIVAGASRAWRLDERPLAFGQGWSHSSALISLLEADFGQPDSGASERPCCPSARWTFSEPVIAHRSLLSPFCPPPAPWPDALGPNREQKICTAATNVVLRAEPIVQALAQPATVIVHEVGAGRLEGGGVEGRASLRSNCRVENLRRIYRLATMVVWLGYCSSRFSAPL